MRHVLVIEDNPIIASDLCEIAVEAGASSVDTADTPADATARAVAHPPSLIVSDCRIIGGTGPEAVEAIRQRLGDVAVIFVTGTPEDCASCDYAKAVLLKPFVRETIRETVEHALQDASSAEAR